MTTRYVLVNGYTFVCNGYYTDEFSGKFIIPTSEGYLDIKTAFSTNTGDISIKDGETTVDVMQNLTKLVKITDDMSSYTVEMEAEYDDSIALGIIAGSRPTINQAYLMRNGVESMSSTLSDKDAIDEIWAFPVWGPNKVYLKDFRLQYSSKLYKVLQDHTSQSDWTPDVAVSLYVEISNPAEEWPNWRQPIGSHDAYQAGDKVTYSGRHYISVINNNVWAPDVYGWNEAE